MDDTPDLEINGTLTIEEGAYVDLSLDGLADADFSANDDFQIITVSDGISGTFGAEDQESIVHSFAFLDPGLRYDSNSISIDFDRNSATFADFAETENEQALAKVLGTGSLVSGHPVYDQVETLTVSEVQAAYNHLSGEMFATTTGTVQTLNQQVNQHILSRLSAQAGLLETENVQVAFSGKGEPERNLFRGTRLWFSGFGGIAHYHGDQNVAATDTSSGGFTAGVESELDIDARIGAAFGYFRTYLDVSDRTSKSEIDTFSGTIYGKAGFGGISVSALLSGSYNQIDSSRYTTFNALPEELAANYGAWSTVAYMEGAYRRDFLGTTVEPFAGVSLAGVATESFVESGNAAALAVESNFQSNIYSTLGLRLAKSFDFANGSRLTLSGETGWRHAFGDIVPTSTAQFASGSDSFSVSGLPLERDTLVLDAAAELELTDKLRNSISYNGQFGSRSNAHELRASVSILF